MLKVIASNTAAQLLAKFFGAGLTLLTTYATIRVAGLEVYGDLTKIFVLVAVGMTAIDFGLNASAIRTSRTPSLLNARFRQVLLARFLLALCSALILNLTIFFLPGGYSPEVKRIFWLGSLSIIFQGFYTSSNLYFQYHLYFWRSTLSVVAGSLFGALLTFLFLSLSPSLYHLVLATTLGYALLSVVSLLLLPRPLLRSLPPLRSALRALRTSLPLGLILLLSVLASKIDTILLGIFRSSSEVGEYGFAYRIFDVILVLPVFTMNVVYPLLTHAPSSAASRTLLRQTTLTMGVLSVAIAALVWTLAPTLLYLKAGMFLSVTTLRYLILALPLFYLTAPLMWHLISRKKDKFVLFTYSLALVFNFVLNYFLIPAYGAPAAALVTGATELLIYLTLLYFSRL